MSLDVGIAEKFIHKLAAYTEYNINIMNEKGIIIASRNPARTGNFHETAFNMLSKRKDAVEVFDKDEFLGVQPGVNLTVIFEGERVGVVGVTGSPDEVRQIAMIIKMAMETMLEYEHQKDMMVRRQNLKEQFISQLIYEENADRTQLKNKAEKLGYKEQCLRIPVLCTVEKGMDPKEILKRIKSGQIHTSQDISFVTQQKILVFKTLPEGENILADYKYAVDEYVEEFVRESAVGIERCRFCIGTIQNQFSNYQSAYRHCSWLENHVRTDTSVLYFYDYIDDYMKDIIPMMEMHKIFNVFPKELTEKFTDSFVEIIRTLKKNNYNLEVSSKELYVHKNTLTFRLDKIRNQLNMNPVRESKDREFVEFLYYYLNKQK